MLTLQIELLGPLMVEERLQQAERRYLYSTLTDNSNLFILLIGAAGSGLIDLGCRLQLIAKRPCPDPSVTRVDLVTDGGC